MASLLIFMVIVQTTFLYGFGYKSFPIFALHQPFHLVKGVVVDYLYCVLLRVVKMLTEFWFSKSHRSKPYYIGAKVLLCMQIYYVYCVGAFCQTIFLYIFHVQDYDKGCTNSRYYANTSEHPCYTKKLTVQEK